MAVDGLVDLLVFVQLPGFDSEDESFLSEGKLDEPQVTIFDRLPLYTFQIGEQSLTEANPEFDGLVACTVVAEMGLVDLRWCCEYQPFGF